MKKVLIIYKFLPQYRLDFFNRLKNELLASGVDLQLVYGKLKNTDALRKDEVDLSWGHFIPSKVFRVGSTELLWQPCLDFCREADLVIVEQANKLLINYYLMISRNFAPYKFALWGHGRNMQDHPNSIRNTFKSLFIRQCDWWFAYTGGVKNMLVSMHFPAEKITVVQNAIDTTALQQYYRSIPSFESVLLKEELGIRGSRVGIYCGGMYPDKRIDFILECCRIVHDKIPDFHMIFVGSGIESQKVIAAAAMYPWIHYTGPKFGNDRVKYFKIASVQLMPYLVGLGILDSFALETPIITTDDPKHGPEIEYLENGKNGIITHCNIKAYSDAVIGVLSAGTYEELIEDCAASAQRYTLDNMVENFKNGVLKCLD